MVTLPSFGGRSLKASMWPSGVPVALTQSEAGVTLTLPLGSADSPDRVVLLTRRK
jgi:hypothetical protein